MPEQT